MSAAPYFSGDRSGTWQKLQIVRVQEFLPKASEHPEALIRVFCWACGALARYL
jgi:hypothetical protein